jgi:FkbM family methyltransferase
MKTVIPISRANAIRLRISKLSRKAPQFRRFKPFLFLLWLLDSALRTSKSLTSVAQGVTYQLDTNDLIDFRLLYFGNHDPEVVTYLKQQIGKTSAVLWDIGANVGAISLPLAAACPNLQIHAFEPSPLVFSRLQTNVDLNPHLTITSHPVALSNQSEMIDFFVSTEPHNSGVGNLAKTSNSNSTPVQVQCYAGDLLIEQGLAPAPTFIKIDVEGFEYEVFCGLNSLLKSGSLISQIVFEHEPYRLRDRHLPLTCVTQLLQQHGFQLFVLSETKLSELHESHLQKHCNLVACRTSC